MDAPAVAVSRDGKRIAVAWMDERTGRNDRKVYWSGGAGGAFAREAPIADDPKGQKGHPSVAIDAKGTVHAVWEDDRSGEQRIFYASSEKGSKNAPLSPAEGKAGFPTLACGKVVGAAFEWDGNAVFRAVGK